MIADTTIQTLLCYYKNKMYTKISNVGIVQHLFGKFTNNA